MRIKLIFQLIFCVWVYASLVSCGKFNPFDDKIDSSSDGAYVVETSQNDAELLQSGLVVVYRFQSVPGLVAVRRSDVPTQPSMSLYSAPNLRRLIEENTRVRTQVLPPTTVAWANAPCQEAYCEAGFVEALATIKNRGVTLKPVDVAVVDSGVVPSTKPITNILKSSDNYSGVNDVNSWLPHATMITSLFSGVVSTPGALTPKNVYAANAVVHSVKISFEGDPSDAEHKQYGSMQLAVALDKAISLGAKIVNLSLTYNNIPDDNVAFIEKALMAVGAQKGVFFVAAAGNDGLNLDTNPVYPASYNVNNLIVVGSHTSTKHRVGSSNYGKTVDVSAQGAAILVNDKAGNQTMAGGTSFAAPLVVSALSLYLGAQTQYEAVNQVLPKLFAAATPTYNGPSNTTISHYGRLNVEGLF